jgi:hypothetical protein
MKAIFALVAVVAALAYTDAKAASIQEEHPIGWYDCSGKRDGNYVHPTDCTRFISCSGGVASQRDCANCNQPGRCIDGRTVYNATVDACLFADETRCENGNGESSSYAPPEVTDGPEPTTSGSGNPDPTTEGQNDPRPPQEGDPCDPDLCENVGYCQHYFRCGEDGKLVREECGTELVWNPRFSNGTKQIHGGNCDTWENLASDIEAEYRKDKECLACFWRSLGECSRTYEYQPPNQRHRNVLTLSCSDGLVFSEAKETCQLCSDVRSLNGTSCC